MLGFYRERNVTVTIRVSGFIQGCCCRQDSALARHLEGSVDGNGGKPSRERGGFPETREVPHRAEECLLRHILRVMFGASQTKSQPINPAFVARDQGLEGGQVSILGDSNQFLII
jgi:hypothetical protein